jgi:hypothetical protein
VVADRPIRPLTTAPAANTINTTRMYGGASCGRASCRGGPKNVMNVPRLM